MQNWITTNGMEVAEFRYAIDGRSHSLSLLKTWGRVLKVGLLNGRTTWAITNLKIADGRHCMSKALTLGLTQPPWLGFHFKRQFRRLGLNPLFACFGAIMQEPIPMMCERDGCDKPADYDCEPIPGTAEPGWENEPTARCEEHAKGLLILRRCVDVSKD